MSLCLWDFPGKNIGGNCHFLLQGIFPIQGLNPHCLLSWQTDSLSLIHWGNPRALVYLQGKLLKVELLGPRVCIYNFLTGITSWPFKETVPINFQTVFRHLDLLVLLIWCVKKWYLVALIYISYVMNGGFSSGSNGKESACNTGDQRSIPGSRRSPGEGNGNPLQYSCLENPMDRGAWQATVCGVIKSRTRQSNWAHVMNKVEHLRNAEGSL